MNCIYLEDELFKYKKYIFSFDFKGYEEIYQNLNEKQTYYVFYLVLKNEKIVFANNYISTKNSKDNTKSYTKHISKLQKMKWSINQKQLILMDYQYQLNHFYKYEYKPTFLIFLYMDYIGFPKLGEIEKNKKIIVGYDSQYIYTYDLNNSVNDFNITKSQFFHDINKTLYTSKDKNLTKILKNKKFDKNIFYEFLTTNGYLNANYSELYKIKDTNITYFNYDKFKKSIVSPPQNNTNQLLRNKLKYQLKSS